MLLPLPFLALLILLPCRARAQAGGPARGPGRAPTRGEMLAQLAASPPPVPPGTPADFECAWRALAADFAAQLQPWRPASAVHAVHDALQLQTLCNVTRGLPAPAEAAAAEASSAAAALPADALYVDAARGDDRNDGSRASPMAHVAAAVARARALPPPSAPRTVVLRGGAPHRLAATLALSPADSGLTLRAYPGETPIITGGVALATAWRPLRAAAPCTWQTLPGENAMYGDWPSQRIVNASAAASAADCQGVCARAAACTAYIFYSADGPYGPAWSGRCFLRTDGAWRLTAEAAITSGRCVAPPNIYAADLAAGGTPLPPSVTAAEDFVLTLLVATTPGQGDGGYMRPIRARFPDCDPETCRWPAGWASAGQWTPPAARNHTQVTHVAFPDNYSPGLFTDYWLGSGGPCAILGDGDGAPGGGGANASYWCQPNGRVSGAAYFFRQPSGLTAPLPHAPYAAAAANGAVLHYWRPFHWYSAFARVAAAATDRATNLTSLRWTFGGFHGAEGSDAGEDYFIDHVAEELDAPREFYFDAAAQTLYYFHNATAGTPPPAGWVFEAPMLHALINVTGSAAAPVANVTLLGLTLTGAAASFFKPHGLPAGGDWTAARIGALTAEGSVGLTVANCTFSRLDGNAVVLNGWNRGATIDASEFTLLGESAVVSWGRVDGADASAGMQPRGTVLSRSLCHEIGLYEKQASCYFATLSGQATVADNVFFNMPRAAICFNDDAIGGSLVTRNLVFATCLESQDHGPFNAWGRVPYVINFPNGSASNGAKPQDDEISFNLVVAGGGANSAALDHDDGSSYYFNHHNVHVYGGHKSNFDGHNKRSVDNLMLFPVVYAPQCMRIFPSLPVASADARWAEQFVNNTCILAGAADWYLDLGPDGCAPGAAVATQIVLENNSVLVPPGSNGSVRCGSAVLTFEQWMASGSERGTTLGAVPPTAQIVAWARALLGMAA